MPKLVRKLLENQTSKVARYKKGELSFEDLVVSKIEIDIGISRLLVDFSYESHQRLLDIEEKLNPSSATRE